jgi:phage host-nuclease inhibitor protein Gam
MRQIVIAIIGILATCIFTSCATVEPGSAILDHQREVTRLEGRIADLQGRIDKYTGIVSASEQRLANLADRAGGAIGTVDELIQLFGEYQREVERLLQDYHGIQNEAVDSD